MSRPLALVVGIAAGVKVCTGCKNEKPLSEYYVRKANARNQNRFESQCKACVQTASKRWADANPERKRDAARDYARRDPLGRGVANHRRSKLKSRFGLTEAAYDAMLAGQNGVCAICLNPEWSVYSRTGRIFELAVDHDHKTGKVRGLLCRACNFAIGGLKESPELFHRALEYLERAK